MYVKADFAYDASEYVHRCQAGETLKCRQTRDDNGLRMRRCWTDACQDCPVKGRCATGKERRITRWEHEHLVDEMQDRITGGAGLMRLRRSMVEHPFGTIKA